MRIAIAVVMLVVAAGQAQSAFMSIGVFTGDVSEGFEATPQGVFVDNYLGILGGQADAFAIGPYLGLHTTTGWGYYSTIFPHGGTAFAGNFDNAWSIVFDTPVTQFGGYFGTNSVRSATDAPDGTASFYDASNSLLGTASISLGLGGTWTWNGWSFDGMPVKSVTLSSGALGGGYPDGGFLMLDDLQATTTVTPEPASLALAGFAGIGMAVAALRRRRQAKLQAA